MIWQLMILPFALPSLPTGISLNESDGTVDVAAGTSEGLYSFDYEVCETSSRFNCDIATATIEVDFPPLPITADNDTGSVTDSSLGFTSVLNVLDNDSIDGESRPTAFDLSISLGSALPPGLTFNTNTGAVGVLSGTPSGIYSFDYDLCEDGDPANCETATVTIDVTNNGGPSVCPAGTALTTGTFNVVSAVGGQNPNFAVGTPLAEGSTETGGSAAVTYSGPITMDLTGDASILVPEGEVIEIVLSSAWGTAARAILPCPREARVSYKFFSKLAVCGPTALSIIHNAKPVRQLLWPPMMRLLWKPHPLCKRLCSM